MDLFIEKSIQPMLIGAEGNPFDDAGYVYELKLDGERCIAYLAPDTGTDLRNKRNMKMLPKVPELDNYYHKVDIAVTDPETGKIYYPMMYEMDERYREPSLPSFSYLGGIAEGYRQNNMDTRPLYDALYKTERQVDELYAKRMRESFSAQEKPGPQKNSRGRER